MIAGRLATRQATLRKWTMEVTGRGLQEAATNLALALLYAAFAWVHLRVFALHPRTSILIVVVMESIVALLFVLRSPASRTSTSAWSWFTTVGGTFAPFLLRPTGAESDLAIGQIVQAAGAVMAILSLASLNRSFGLLPAVRSVRSGGAYRVVRHPLYAAYTVQNLGYLASNLSGWNCVVVALALAFQVLRVLNEERLLSSEPTYRVYMDRTRWRLVPYLF
jgi:protein-S-isoprenylcysteine O-methyltransferase Ste14